MQFDGTKIWFYIFTHEFMFLLHVVIYVDRSNVFLFSLEYAVSYLCPSLCVELEEGGIESFLFRSNGPFLATVLQPTFPIFPHLPQFCPYFNLFQMSYKGQS